MRGPDGSTQASHINVGVFARGMLKRLFTRIYFTGDPAVSAGVGRGATMSLHLPVPREAPRNERMPAD